MSISPHQLSETAPTYSHGGPPAHVHEVGYGGDGGLKGGRTGSMMHRGVMPSQMSGPMTVGMPTGMGGGAMGGATNPGAVDVIGPILRRKFLVFFLALIGGGISLLLYANAEVIYGSGLQLLITSQAPPVVVNGETVMQKVSTVQHQKLLGSQLILERAVGQGQLQRLPMFEQQIPEMIVLDLQKNLKITTPKLDDQTVQIGLEGKFAEDLPVVLNAVVRAYQEEVVRDSKSSGQESVELITKLLDSREREKNEAQAEYIAILTKLDLPNIEQNGGLVNPFNEELHRITAMRNAALSEMRDVTNRYELVKQAITSADATRLTHVVSEAKKYLGTTIETVDTLEERRITNYELARQVNTLEREMAELLLRQEAANQSLGSRHPVVLTINRRILMTKQHLESAKARYSMDESDPQGDGQKSLEAKLEQRNRTWVDVYHVALEADQQRLSFKVAQLDEELALVEQQARAVSADFVQLNVLRARIAEKQKNIDEVLAQLSQVDVVTKNFTDIRVRVIDPAAIGARVAPSLVKYSAIGLFIGGLLGVGLAILIDRSDMTFRNPGEIFDRLKVPVICKLPAARIPRTQQNSKLNPALTCLFKPTSKMAESIRAARTSLLFTSQADGSKVFLFTSPSPGDGKSTTTSNLAISMAQAGKKVVLVDADFRRPRVHVYFGEEMEPGILQAVTGTEPLDNCLRTSEQEGLYLLASGGRPKNPGEIVTSVAFAKMINDLRERFDMVLIDSPPLLPVADATVISSLVDGIYMIIRIRKGVVVTSSKAKEKLDMVNANLLGIIVNGVDDNPHYNEYGSYGYGYGYNYGYGNGGYYESRNSKYQEKIG